MPISLHQGLLLHHEHREAGLFSLTLMNAVTYIICLSSAYAHVDVVCVGAEWVSVCHEEESKRLCACLMLAAPLAAAATCLQNDITSIHQADAAQLAPADRISYPALSAVVTACQIQTAWVIDGAAVEDVCPSTVFGCFWEPACVAGYTG